MLSNIKSLFESYLEDMIKYANNSPRDFIFLVLIILSPFFLLSAFLSWKLAKHLEREKKKKTKPGPRQSRELKGHKTSRVKRE